MKSICVATKVNIDCQFRVFLQAWGTLENGVKCLIGTKIFERSYDWIKDQEIKCFSEWAKGFEGKEIEYLPVWKVERELRREAEEGYLIMFRRELNEELIKRKKRDERDEEVQRWISSNNTFPG